VRRAAHEGKRTRVHRTVSPCSGQSAGQLPRTEAGGCTGSGRTDVEGVRGGTGAAAGEPAQPGTSGNVPGATFPKSVHTERGWTAEMSGHGCAGGHNRSARWHHVCVGTLDIQRVYKTVRERGYKPPKEPAVNARDGRWLLQLYDRTVRGPKSWFANRYRNHGGRRTWTVASNENQKP
jgi:hypothetical protein